MSELFSIYIAASWSGLTWGVSVGGFLLTFFASAFAVFLPTLVIISIIKGGNQKQ